MSLFLSRKSVFARERLTATSLVVKTLTASKYEQAVSPVGGNQQGVFKNRATGAIVKLTSVSGSMSFTVDGTDPTAGTTVTDIGQPVVAGDSILLETHDAIVNFKAIALGSDDAIFEVWYCR